MGEFRPRWEFTPLPQKGLETGEKRVQKPEANLRDVGAFNTWN